MTCDQLVSTCAGWPNGEKLAPNCVRIWARPKSTQVSGWPNETRVERESKTCVDFAYEFEVNTSGWPNETQVERKSKTCIDLRVRLARALELAFFSEKAWELFPVSRIEVNFFRSGVYTLSPILLDNFTCIERWAKWADLWLRTLMAVSLNMWYSWLDSVWLGATTIESPGE